MIKFSEWLIREGKKGNKGKKGKNMKTVTEPKDNVKYTPVTGKIDQTGVGTGHIGKIGGGAGVHGATKDNPKPRKKNWKSED